MQARNFTLSRYLERIGHDGPVAPDIATVAALMRPERGAVMVA